MMGAGRQAGRHNGGVDRWTAVNNAREEACDLRRTLARHVTVAHARTARAVTLHGAHTHTSRIHSPPPSIPPPPAAAAAG